MKTGLSIGLAVAIGAIATWFWTSREVRSVAGATAKTQRAAPQATLALSEHPKVAPTVASGSPHPVDTNAVLRDDSLYDQMLAFAQNDRLSTSTARDLIEKRERFLYTPDDLEWGRQTERALRDFFQAKTAGTLLQITSISCRSAGCEVQALSVRPLCGGISCELQMQRERPPPQSEPDNVDPVALLRTDWPAGLPLRREALILQVIDDHIGALVTYSRDARKSE